MSANYAALATTGHNIANANVAGYSRQQVELATASGQFTGAGFFGKGVDVATVTRAHDEFLTREAATAGSLAAMDSTRLGLLNQLESVFPTGEQGVGHAAGQFLNSMVDLAARPADAATRQVVLARAGEVADRFAAAGGQLDVLQLAVQEDLKANVAEINQLARNVAELNQRIASVLGLGHSPNDLLDQRDQRHRRAQPEAAAEHGGGRRRLARHLHRRWPAPGAGHAGAGAVGRGRPARRVALGARPVGERLRAHPAGAGTGRRRGGRPAALPEQRPGGRAHPARPDGCGAGRQGERAAGPGPGPARPAGQRRADLRRRRRGGDARGDERARRRGPVPRPGEPERDRCDAAARQRVRAARRPRRRAGRVATDAPVRRPGAQHRQWRRGRRHAHRHRTARAGADRPLPAAAGDACRERHAARARRRARPGRRLAGERRHGRPPTPARPAWPRCAWSAPAWTPA